MQNSVERQAFLVSYFDANRSRTVAYVLADLRAKGYSMYEIRYAYRAWMNETV